MVDPFTGVGWGNQRGRPVAVADLARIIRSIGPKSVVISSDLGQRNNPAHPDGLRAFMFALQNEGLTAQDGAGKSRKIAWAAGALDSEFPERGTRACGKSEVGAMLARARSAEKTCRGGKRKLLFPSKVCGHESSSCIR